MIEIIQVYTLNNPNFIIKEKKQITINNWKMIFREPNKKEGLSNCIVCELRKTINPSKDILAILEDLSKNIIPSGAIPNKTIMEDNNHYKKNHIPSMSEMCQDFQTYITKETSDGIIILREILKLIKWRKNTQGTIKLASRNHLYSTNGKYYNLPHTINMSIEIRNETIINEINLNEIKKFYNNKVNLTSYDLLLNISELIGKDIRAAYIQSCCTAEIAIKEFLFFLNPNMNDFFLKIPTPPVEDILKEISNTNLNNKLSDELFPRKLIKTMGTIFKHRNKLIHRGKFLGNISKKDIEFLIDFIYLLYFYQNYNRAKGNISDAFLTTYFDT